MKTDYRQQTLMANSFSTKSDSLLTFAKVMEHFFFSCYNWGYETPWEPKRAGEAATKRHRAIEKGESKSVGCCPVAGGIQELRLTMVPRIPRKGSQWPAPPGRSRAADKALVKTERRFGQVATRWAAVVWISDRSLDPAAGGSDNSEGIWRSISSQPRLAVAFGDGVELPKAGTSSLTAERRRDCSLEAAPLAAYKKTPQDLAPPCSSWMKVDFCSFRRSPALGLQRARPPIVTTSINSIGFRR